MPEVQVHSFAKDKLRQKIVAGSHHLEADAPQTVGGDDAGPDPHQLLLSALGTCTAMTLQLYAKRKGWDLQAVEVKVSQSDEADNNHHSGLPVVKFKREINVSGNLTTEQIDTLKSVANKCPIHKILEGPKEIATFIEANSSVKSS